MQLSHILYKVKDLHEAVTDFTNMGFTVTYGAEPNRAFNALIWFDEGPFIELFEIKRNRFIVGLLKFLGKKELANRVSHFQNADFGWVD